MNKIESCGRRIEKALSIRNMKQSELSKLTKVPKSSLSLYIKEAYEPKQDKIYAMAKALNVSDMWLMGYDVPMVRNDITSTELTGREKDMLEIFRQIPDKQQEILMQMLHDGLKTKELFQGR